MRLHRMGRLLLTLGLPLAFSFSSVSYAKDSADGAPPPAVPNVVAPLAPEAVNASASDGLAVVLSAVETDAAAAKRRRPAVEHLALPDLFEADISRPPAALAGTGAPPAPEAAPAADEAAGLALCVNPQWLPFVGTMLGAAAVLFPFALSPRVIGLDQTEGALALLRAFGDLYAGALLLAALALAAGGLFTWLFRRKRSYV